MKSKCEGCQNEIDPDVCCCGDGPDNHPWNAGHGFVPMGCACGYDISEFTEEDIPMSGTHREGRDTNPPRRSLYDLREHDNNQPIKEPTMNYEYATPAVSELETFANPFPKGMSGIIHIEAPEFTSLCPKTGLPDFANIVVDYIPNKLCLESKSYKLYLVGFRQHGAFHESCVTKIYTDLKTLLDPAYLKVEGRFSPRGGISFWPSLESTAEDTLENHDTVELPTLSPEPCLHWCASRIGLDCNCRDENGKPDPDRQD